MPSLEQIIAEKAAKDPGFAIAYAILELSDTHKDLVKAIYSLGLNNAETPMGAVELLASEVKRLADAAEVFTAEKA